MYLNEIKLIGFVGQDAELKSSQNSKELVRSADYIHLYNGDKKTLAESLSVIQETSSKILDQLLPEQRTSPFHEKPDRSLSDMPTHSHDEPGRANPAQTPPMQDQSDSISLDR